MSTNENMFHEVMGAISQGQRATLAIYSHAY